jgi:hypothetical protein
MIGPIIGALLFVLGMSAVPEPNKRTVNVLFAAGASGVYISGGFGLWELLFASLALPMAYMGTKSYRYIGVFWLMHSAWDLPHHIWNHPIWPFQPTSSFGCFVFDPLIAIWFLLGAPSIWHPARTFYRAAN